MQLRNCEHPVEVCRNGIVNFLPCGKCDICRHNHNVAWSERIRLESQCHKYHIFGTLTYADMFLPRMIPCSKGYVIVEDEFGVKDAADGQFLYFPYKHEACQVYEDAIMSERGFIPVLSKHDVQNFFKKVRRYIDYHFCKNLSKDEKKKFEICYAVCGEYAPTVYRPHYHFNLFFDNAVIARNIKEILRSCWSYGSSSFRWSSDSASSRYVAQYVNSVSRVPDLYKIREICPFLLVSKKHPFGSYKISKEEIHRVYTSASPTFNCFDSERGQNVTLPLWKYLENRLFPTFSGFSFIPVGLRARLLGLSARCKTIEEWKEVANSYRSDIDKHLLDRDIQVSDYFTCRLKNAFLLHDKKRVLYDLENDYSRLLEHLFDSVTSSIWRCSRTMIKNIHKFQVDNSIEDCVIRVGRYQHNKQMYNLKQQYLFANQLKNDVYEYIDMSNTCPYSVREYSEQLRILKSSIDSSHKNKRKYEYLNLHPEYKAVRRYDEFLEGLT